MAEIYVKLANGTMQKVHLETDSAQVKGLNDAVKIIKVDNTVSADKLANAKEIKIQDADGNASTAVNFDGSANVNLKLPDTILNQRQLDTNYQKIGMARHTRTTFTLANLISAVADQNLDKYGIKVGDYYVGASGYTYIVAGLNPLKGTHQYTITNNHCGLIVCTHTTHSWNDSGNTYTGADNRGAGYANSDLHYYLVNTVLPKVKGDLGESHLYAHQKLLSNAVNTTQYNRFGTNTGGASNWSWYNNQYISALTEHQVYGGIAWSSSGYDTGEADQQLEVFKKFKHTDIFGNEYVWLRDVASASYACFAAEYGIAYDYTASFARYVAALIAFH